jgi:hypothetical protein
MDKALFRAYVNYKKYKLIFYDDKAKKLENSEININIPITMLPVTPSKKFFLNVLYLIIS